MLVQEHILHDVPALGVAALERDGARGRDRAGGVTRDARGDQTKHRVPMLGGVGRGSLNARRRVAGGGDARRPIAPARRAKKSLTSFTCQTVCLLLKCGFRRKRSRSISPSLDQKHRTRQRPNSANLARGRGYRMNAGSADNKARITPTGAVRRAAAAFPATRCRPRSPSLSTATTRGTPSCSAMADSACPSRLRAYRRLDAQRIRRGLGLNEFSIIRERASPEPARHRAADDAFAPANRDFVRARGPSDHGIHRVRRSREPLPSHRARFVAKPLSVSILTATLQTDRSAVRVPSAALSTTATRAW